MQPIIYQSDEEENSKKIPQITRKCQFWLFGDIGFFLIFFPNLCYSRVGFDR